MQKHGIQARGKRRFRVATTDSRHNLPVAPIDICINNAIV
jgi:putative transposase